MNGLPKSFLRTPLIVLALYIVLEVALFIGLAQFYKFSNLFWIDFFAMSIGLITINFKRNKPSMANLMQSGADTNMGMRVIACILLIIPGFITDLLGLFLFIPPIQKFVSARIQKRLANLPLQNVMSQIPGQFGANATNPFAGFQNPRANSVNNPFYANNSQQSPHSDDIIDVEYEISPKPSSPDIKVRVETPTPQKPLALLSE